MSSSLSSVAEVLSWFMFNVSAVSICYCARVMMLSLGLEIFYIHQIPTHLFPNREMAGTSPSTSSPNKQKTYIHLNHRPSILQQRPRSAHLQGTELAHQCNNSCISQRPLILCSSCSHLLSTIISYALSIVGRKDVNSLRLELNKAIPTSTFYTTSSN